MILGTPHAWAGTCGQNAYGITPAIAPLKSKTAKQQKPHLALLPAALLVVGRVCVWEGRGGQQSEDYIWFHPITKMFGAKTLKTQLVLWDMTVPHNATKYNTLRRPSHEYSVAQAIHKLHKWTPKMSLLAPPYSPQYTPCASIINNIIISIGMTTQEVCGTL